MKGGSLVYLLTLIFLFRVCLPFGATQPSFSNGKRLTQEEGLIHNDVIDIVQDAKGFIWIATSRGLSRFDGTNIKNFTTFEGDPTALPSDNILDLMVDNKGRLWVGTYDGLAIYDENREYFKVYQDSLNHGGILPGSKINTIFQDRDGQVWLGIGEIGFCLFDEAREVVKPFEINVKPPDKTIDVSRINTILSITGDVKNDSILWVATLSGLIEYNKHTEQYHWHYFRQANADRQFRTNTFRTILAHPNGKLYLGSWGGASIFDPETERFEKIKVSTQALRLPLSERTVISICQYDKRKILITYNMGLIVFDANEQKVTDIKLNDTEKALYYSASFLDKERRIWGVGGHGVSIFNPSQQQFNNFYYSAKLPDFYYLSTALVESTDDRYLYIAAINGEGLYIFDRSTNQWEVIYPEPFDLLGAEGLNAMDMLRLDDNQILILTDDRFALFLEKERRLVPYPFAYDFKAPFFRKMIFDDAGNLWLGSRRNGLYKINLQKKIVQNYQEELVTPQRKNRYIWIENLLKDSKGNIWIRTASDYSIYDVAKDTIYNIVNTNSDSPTYLPDISNFVEDDQGRVWISGYGFGLGEAHIDSPTQGIIRKYTKKNGFKELYAGVASLDKKGRIWIRNENGISHFEPSSGKAEYYYEGYGLPEERTSLLKTISTGEMVMGMKKGICIFHPDSLRKNKEIPKPYLTSFKVFDREIIRDTSLLALDHLSLSYQQNFFSFEFSAIGFNFPEKHIFAHMLEGVDEDWVYAGRRNYAAYTNIDGGDYIFKVKVANNEGQWNEEPFALKIHITTPWWKTWWFWLSLIGLILLLSFFFIRWRIDLIRKKEALKANFEKRLANVELNALRAQMNPHFIFNCLNSIDYYILKNDMDNASDYLNRFSRLIRLILQNSRSNYVNLKDEMEALKLYIEMESLRFEEQFDYSVKISKGLKMEEIEIPPMLLQPYVENAIWHGLMQKEGKGKLELIIAQKNGHLHCIIEDNGIGRAAAKALRSKTATKRKSFGMQITNDRIGIINKLYNADASIIVEDLKNEKGEATGTRVKLEIPI